MTKARTRISVVRRRKRYYLRIWCGGKLQGERATGTTVRREAERAAIELEEELARGEQVYWGSLRQAYERRHIAKLSRSHAAVWHTAASHLEETCRPSLASDITTAMLSRLSSSLRDDGASAETCRTYQRYLMACLRWGVEQGMLPEAPRPPRIAAKRGRKAKGRPLSEEDYRGCLAAVELEVGPDRSEAWIRVLECLWLSGLRLAELHSLRWEPRPGCFHIHSLRRGSELLGLDPDRDKAGSSGMCPIAPDWADWLRFTPAGRRRGWVVDPLGKRGGRLATAPAVGKVIVAICRRAGVEATAHDFRRAFATRWSRLVMPATLQLMARHEHIATTMQYYVEHDAASVSREARVAWESKGQEPPALGIKRSP